MDRERLDVLSCPLELFLKGLDLFLAQSELPLSSLYISHDVLMRLSGSLEHALLKLHLIFLSVELITEGLNLGEQLLVLPLLGLQAVRKEEGLLNASLSSGGSRCDGGNKGASYSIGSPIHCSIAIRHMHNGAIELFLDQFILGESLLAYSKLGPDICSAHPLDTLEFVVLCP